MRIAPMALRSIILLGSFFIASDSVLAQTPPTPPPQPKIVGAPEIIIDRNTGKGTVLLHLRNSDPAQTISLSMTGLVNTSTGIKPKITFNDAPSDKNQPVKKIRALRKDSRFTQPR